MKFLNFGSLNIDKVYKVPHFVSEGETLSSVKYDEFAGGKGLNQSIALSKAGACVFHAGKVGKDGSFLKQTLIKQGVNVENVREDGTITGHAIIQVDSNGQNCILLFGGANKEITKEQIDSVIDRFDAEDILVLQNEINEIDYIINTAKEKGMSIALNPSPIDEKIININYDKIDYLILNEIEGKDISGEEEPKKILDTLLSKHENLKIVLTLGGKGVVYKDKNQMAKQDIFKVDVVDSTAAGDTFMGYFLSIISQSNDVKLALRIASKAASIAVSRKGASSSIPLLDEVKC
ncbi:MAG: ribokinase [Oscillospiraceae bacterium]